MLVVTTDLHLTDRPEHAYRFEYLYWLAETYAGNHTLLILGDLTDSKNNHSARLVNRISAAFSMFAANFREVVLLKGNHDYTEPSEPFFEFLPYVSDTIHYIKEPYAMDLSMRLSDSPCDVLLLPHSFDPIKAWADLEFNGYSYIFMHQTVSGSRASTGQELEGIPAALFKFEGFTGHVYSGDVHVPQTIGNVTYVGSPYHVHFGDNFKPRLITIDSHHKPGEFTEHFYTQAPKRVSAVIDSLADLDTYDFKPGDHVKVKMRLPKAELADWHEHKKAIVAECAWREVKTFGIEVLVIKSEQAEAVVTSDAAEARISVQSDPKKVLEHFAKRENVEGYVSEIGKELLDANK